MLLSKHTTKGTWWSMVLLLHSTTVKEKEVREREYAIGTVQRSALFMHTLDCQEEVVLLTVVFFLYFALSWLVLSSSFLFYSSFFVITSGSQFFVVIKRVRRWRLPPPSLLLFEVGRTKRVFFFLWKPSLWLYQILSFLSSRFPLFIWCTECDAIASPLGTCVCHVEEGGEVLVIVQPPLRGQDSLFPFGSAKPQLFLSYAVSSCLEPFSFGKESEQGGGGKYEHSTNMFYQEEEQGIRSDSYTNCCHSEAAVMHWRTFYLSNKGSTWNRKQANLTNLQTHKTKKRTNYCFPSFAKTQNWRG